MPPIVHIETKRISARTYYGRFCVEPLPVGQGITLGNSLRRALLGDLPGVAPSAATIVGALHEYSTLPGVRESVLEILMNLKQIVFKKRAKGSCEMIAHLRVMGPAIVTAKDLKLPELLQVVDPSQYIATLSTNTPLELRVYLSHSTGYRLKRGSLPVPDPLMDTGMILHIDALFFPVSRVNYRVEEQIFDGRPHEQLLLEIWTNGSLSPRQALDKATMTLIRILGSLQAPPRSRVERVAPKTSLSDPRSKARIESLELSVRSFNCLKRANIKTVADLVAYSREELLQLKNFGTKSASEVVQVVRRLGLVFRGEEALEPASDQPAIDIQTEPSIDQSAIVQAEDMMQSSEAPKRKPRQTRTKTKVTPDSEPFSSAQSSSEIATAAATPAKTVSRKTRSKKPALNKEG